MSRSNDRVSRREPIADRQQPITHFVVAHRFLAAFSTPSVVWAATLLPLGRCIDRNRLAQALHQCPRLRIVRRSWSHQDVIHPPGTGNGSCVLDFDRIACGAMVDQGGSISVSRFQATVGRLRAPMGLRARVGGVVLPPDSLVGKDLHGHSNFQ